MKLELASTKDNQELIKLYSEFDIKGWVQLKPKRFDDYFSPYRIQGEEFKTYLLRDDVTGKITATASFVFRETFTDGKVEKIATATDLRVTPNRKAVLQWSQHFLPVMDEVAKIHNVSQFFSMINLTDPTALNTFVRPRTMKRPLPRYYLYRKFSLVTLHGKFPWAPKPLKTLKIREGSAVNQEQLYHYLLHRSSFRPFASVGNKDSFTKKMARMPGFQFSNFLIAFDAYENIVGCVAPWRANNIQDLIPLSYTSMRAHNFRQFLKFARFLGWTHPLTKPVASTGIEQPLQFQFLTHLCVDNEDVFESLLWEAYSRTNPNEFMMYAHVDQDFRVNPPEDWIAAKIPYALYSVVTPSSEAPAFLHPSIAFNPEIEAMYVI